MKQTQRHNGIIELVKQQGYVSTEELVEHFSVSPQTIRRDLNELAEQNLILRHHGGAALPSSSVNTPWHDRKATQTEEKERIARKVAEQIPNGSLLEFDYHEVRTKRAIIENSRHVMLVVDHSKFGRNAMVNMGSISMVDAVYTDAPPPVSVMQVLTDHHIQLELC